MSSIIKIILSSPVLMGVSLWVAILVTCGIVSKIAEVTGKRELSKQIDYAISLFWVCSIVVLVLGAIGFGIHTVVTM